VTADAASPRDLAGAEREVATAWLDDGKFDLYHVDFMRQSGSPLWLTGPQVAGLAVGMSMDVTDTDEVPGDVDVLVYRVVDVRPRRCPDRKAGTSHPLSLTCAGSKTYSPVVLSVSASRSVMCGAPGSHGRWSTRKTSKSALDPGLLPQRGAGTPSCFTTN